MNQKFQSYIAGQWVAGQGSQADENPSDLATPVGEYGVLDAAQVAQAVDAAAAALPAWSLTSPQQRADLLDAVGSEILARKEELGRLLAMEEGKTLPESIGEAARAGQIFKFFAGEALRIPGEKLASTRPGVDVEITREPVGTVASSRRGISRWRSRRGRSRRRWPPATPWCSSRPKSCRAAPGPSRTSWRAPACRPACSTWCWAPAAWSARR